MHTPSSPPSSFIQKKEFFPTKDGLLSFNVMVFVTLEESDDSPPNFTGPTGTPTENVDVVLPATESVIDDSERYSELLHNSLFASHSFLAFNNSARNPDISSDSRTSFLGCCATHPERRITARTAHDAYALRMINPSLLHTNLPASVFVICSATIATNLAPALRTAKHRGLHAQPRFGEGEESAARWHAAQAQVKRT